VAPGFVSPEQLVNPAVRPHGKWCGFLCVAAMTAAGRAHAQRAPEAWRDFTARLDSLMATDSIPGAAAVLLRDGRIVASYMVGHADRERGQRVDTATLFHYGSITKTLTAIAVMQLRDRGRLTLDDAVTRYIPELRLVHSAHGSIDSVTIRMLLSHSAGFQNPTWPYGRGRAWEPFEPTRWEQLVAMMPYQETRFRPGSRYGYSNPAFIYLARIIEQLTGDQWAVYVQKNIFAPLGMTHSYFGATPYYLADRRANSYTLVRDSAGRERTVANGREFDPGVTIPNGGWNAPLGDLVTYANFLMGVGARDVVLSRRTLDEMWRPVIPVDPSAPAAESVGLSFFVRGGAGTAPLVVGHTGEQSGFRSSMQINPATRTAIAYVVNGTNDARSAESGRAWLELLDRAVAVIR